jgi:hypothetical protein
VEVALRDELSVLLHEEAAQPRQGGGALVDGAQACAVERDDGGGGRGGDGRASDARVGARAFDGVASAVGGGEGHDATGGDEERDGGET